MINLNKKIAAVTLGAALAVTGLLGGLMLNKSAVTASAEEVSPVYDVTVETPTHTATSHYGAVEMTYTGDSATSNSWLYLGESHSDLSSYTVSFGNTYNVIYVPSVGAQYVHGPYEWMQSVIKVDNTKYSSDIVYISGKAYSSTYTISGAVFGSTISSSSYTTFSYSSTATKVYFTCAFNGVAKDIAIEGLSSVKTAATVTVGGVTFYVSAYANKLMVKTSKTILCKQRSESDSNVGAFAYHAE